MRDLTPVSGSSWSSRDAGGYAAGQILVDRYELTRAIGRGGTAVVWVARDSVLDIDVAVKIVLPSTQDISGALKQRTIQEARLSAQLTDPAVCRVLDFGFTRREDPFVVTELLNGETLDDLLTREGRLSTVDAVRLLLPVLDALGAAHKRGIVHRDVKPSNVFLAQSDGRTQPKLLDFGIARSLDASSRTTTTGTICGTPCYMSPEQARGSSDVDPRSDLWSFCVVLYELVTGNAPFLGDNYNATLFAIANDTVPSMASFGCDLGLSRIVDRGMAKEREVRWQSAAELGNALARWLAEQGVASDVCGVSLQRRFIQGDGADASWTESTDASSQRPVTLPPLRASRSNVARPRFLALPRTPAGYVTMTLGALCLIGSVAALPAVTRPLKSALNPPEQPVPAGLAQLTSESRRAPAPSPAPDVRFEAATVSELQAPVATSEPQAPPPPRAVARRPRPSKPSEVAPPPASPAPVLRNLPAPTVTQGPTTKPAVPSKQPDERRPRSGNALAYDFGI